MRYDVHNAGPNPKVVYDANGKTVFIDRGATVNMDLSDDMARIIVRRAGSLSIKLTEEQAAAFNTPPKSPPVKSPEAPKKARARKKRT